MGGTEGFIVSGSEDGDILFWDVQNKNVVQRVSGHEGVVCWVDTCPGATGTVASGGLDGTVRIWVDVGDEETIADLKLDDEPVQNGYSHEGVDNEMTDMKLENGVGGYENDTPRDDMSVDSVANDGKSYEEPDRMEL